MDKLSSPVAVKKPAPSKRILSPIRLSKALEQKMHEASSGKLGSIKKKAGGIKPYKDTSEEKKLIGSLHSPRPEPLIASTLN